MQACPCGSGLPYSDCCGPLHRGAREAVTALELMRSRYSAYALGQRDYLFHSWAPETRPDELLLEPLDWLGLTILEAQGGPGDDVGTVAFRAHYRQAGQTGTLEEGSRFRRHQGRWVYVDGEVAALKPTAAPKMGRNSPCPCGSGRKYKRCCGQ